MCGIVGFRSQLSFNSLKHSLTDAVYSLSHRGPDDSGVVFDPSAGVGLGHRRLSVIDLSVAGHQPMESDEGEVIISYNGEVYNFIELRQILEKLGYKFSSNTDTEVILKSYVEWGPKCVEKFVGMFAIAIWDGRNRLFFLARDRLGIKPLYYYFNRGDFVFSSELKAFMAFRNLNKELDLDAIPQFLHYQYIPAPRTIFKHTYKLLPGNYLIFDGEKIRTQSYWHLPEIQPITCDSDIDEREWLNRLDYLLTTAVSDRLISDVPLGALLSGGVDSSLVVAFMQKVVTSPVRTFTIGFKEKGYNEAPWASQIAKHLGTEHTELYVTPQEALDVIPRLPDIYDEPFADASAIPTFLVSRLTRSQVTVALSGDGGDEQFAGYVRYWMARAIAGYFSKLPEPIKKSLAMVLRFIPSHWIERYYLSLHHRLPQRFKVANFPDKWQKLINLLSHTQMSELYRMTICLWSENEIHLLSGMLLNECRYEEAFIDTDGWPILSQLMRVDQCTYLPDAMLTKVDRASMAASLEVRVPLLDHRVVEFTSKIPENLKYRNGTGKYILKKLLSRYIPTELFERPKMGFGVPIDHWFRTDLKTVLLDYLSPERLKKEGLFNHVLVEKKIREHLSGKNNHQYRLWSLLMWQMWRERWLDS